MRFFFGLCAFFVVSLAGCAGTGSHAGYTFAWIKPPTIDSSTPLASSGQAWAGMPLATVPMAQAGAPQLTMGSPQLAAAEPCDPATAPRRVTGFSNPDQCYILRQDLNRLEAKIDALAPKLPMPKGN
jgi:hypothetical protein